MACRPPTFSTLTDTTEPAYIHMAMIYMRSATTAPGVERLAFIPSETIDAIRALPPAARHSLPVA